MATNRPDSLDSRLKSFLAEARHILSTGGVTPVNLAKVKKAGEKQGLTDEQRDAAVEDLIRTHKFAPPYIEAFRKEALTILKKNGVLTPRVQRELLARAQKHPPLSDETAREIAQELAAENGLQIISEAQALAKVAKKTEDSIEDGELSEQSLTTIKGMATQLGVSNTQLNGILKKMEEVGEAEAASTGRGIGLPLLGCALAGAGVAVLAVAAVFFFGTDFQGKPKEEPKIVKLPDEVKKLNIQPDRVPDPVPVVGRVWWDELPDKNQAEKIARTFAELKRAIPEEPALLERLGEKADVMRRSAYTALTEKMPKLMRKPQAKEHVERFLLACYQWEPADSTVAPLRVWFASQIPKEDLAFPPTFKSEDLECSFWALQMSAEALTHPAIRPVRAKDLAQELGQAFDFALQPGIDPEELKTQLKKRLALRVYGKLVPTAARSLDDALALRKTLIGLAADSLSPPFREGKDTEMAIESFPKALTSWTGYSSLLRESLKSSIKTNNSVILELYRKADDVLAAKMEPVLAEKWGEVIREKALDRDGKANKVLRQLGLPNPMDRLTQVEKMTNESLGNSRAPANQSHAILQEAARFSHVSTLACALLNKGMGIARFDDLLAQVPELTPADNSESTVKVGDPKQPAVDPKQPDAMKPGDDPAGVVVGAAPKVFTGQLVPGFFNKPHTVILKRGRFYTIHMLSPFDNYLFLKDAKGFTLAQDDDSGGNLNALIVWQALYDGPHVVIASSCGGRRVGPYEITVREGAGFGGPGFGGLGMPRPPFGFPVRPLPFKKGFPIPVPNMIPGQPVPAEDDPKLPAAVVAEVPSLVAEADLENLAKQAGGNARTRLNALHNISNLKGDLTQTDLTPRQASIIANYVVRIPTKGGANITELDEAVPYLKPLVKSRNFLLGLADGIDHEKADQQASEAVTGAVVGQLLLFSKDENWRLSCRKLVMRQAAEMSGKKKTAATEAEETLRDLYKEQSILLGMDAAELEKLVRPSQVMESAIKHLAAEISKQDPAPETKEYLDQMPRHLLAAKFVAQNDLEHTAMLQRIWIRVLVPYLEKINPKRINEMRQVQQDMIDGDRLASNVLEQLRDGEEKILRVWGLALDLK